MGTTPDRFPTDIAQSWIVTLHILLASLLRSRRKLTVVLVSRLKTIPSSSSLVMLPLSSWSPASQCVSSRSQSFLLLEGLPSVTWGRPWPSVSSRLPPPRSLRASRPRLLIRLSRRNEMLSRGNTSLLCCLLHMGMKIQKLTIGCIMPLQPWYAKFWRFQLFWKFPKISLYFHRKEFRGYTTKHNCLLVAPSLFRILFVTIRPL